ncbi:uncharacterized protein A4U43_UnF6030 [Asparagus officinalis]|uniref:Uncharacterized protein n=1 Tax=Asparagus officinalis TaxID=4686 RepID=A0A1R3L6K6_ASPOF|nr:uncharacterized protein A4U43_UnF6030 [Asparagus officinalis]
MRAAQSKACIDSAHFLKLFISSLQGVFLRGDVPNLKPASIRLCPHIARDWFYDEDKEHGIKVVVPGLSDCGQLRSKGAGSCL